MKTTINGTIIDGITAANTSILGNDIMAYQDSDGAVIHIKMKDIEIMYNYYKSLVIPQPINMTNQPQKANVTPVEFDNLFRKE